MQKIHGSASGTSEQSASKYAQWTQSTGMDICCWYRLAEPEWTLQFKDNQPPQMSAMALPKLSRFMLNTGNIMAGKNVQSSLGYLSVWSSSL